MTLDSLLRGVSSTNKHIDRRYDLIVWLWSRSAAAFLHQVITKNHLSAFTAMAGVDKQQLSYDEETVVTEVAKKEAAANEKSMPPSTTALDGAALYVPPKDGSIDPDSEEASLEAYARPWAVMTGPTTRLPQEEVDLVLAWEPVCMEPYDEETQRRLFPYELFEEAMEIMREAAEISQESMQHFIEYQDWIRGQMEEKGYVEVPIKFLQDRAEFIEWAQRDLEEMMKNIHIPDKCFARSSVDDGNGKEEGVAP